MGAYKKEEKHIKKFSKHKEIERTGMEKKLIS